MISPGCTIIAIKDQDNYFLGSNSDNPWDTRTKVCIIQGSMYRFIGTKLVSPDDGLSWANMITRGVNEVGIAFTFAYVDYDDAAYTTEKGIGFKEFGNYILGCFDDLSKIESFIRENHFRVHGNFLFADGKGNLLLCELCPTKHSFSWNPSELVLRTNHFQNLNTSNNLHIKETNSINRFHSGLNSLNKQEYTNGAIPSLSSILKNHELDEFNAEWGSSTCNHGSVVGTISSEILDTRNKTLWYCYGAPCNDVKNIESWGHYVPFTLSKYEPGDLTTTDGKIL